MIFTNKTLLLAQKIQKKSGLRFLIVLFLTILFFWACARPMTPAGGPKDEDPPIPIKSNPINYSTNFDQEKIIIQFDEYVVLKNVDQELLISPSLEEKPIIKLRGKNILIKINNELKDSTTYGINFYESIVDLNESNMLKNFQFEFSTGNEFDSLYIAGNVKDAFNYTTTKGLYIMLYKEFNDSLPRTTIPEYVSKTDEDGNFIITNMKNINYYVFALNDLNNNLLFDLPNESIAFLDSTFNPGYKEVQRTKTIQLIDSISPDFNDTIYIDSINEYTEMVTTIGDVQLFMFLEENEQQYFVQYYRPLKEQIILSFNLEVSDSFKITPIIDTTFNETWFNKEEYIKNDSLVLWLTDSVLYNTDSLHFQINYTMKDSNYEDYTRTDTLIIYSDELAPIEEKEKAPKKERKFSLNNLINKKDEVEEDTIVKSNLTFTTNAKTPFELYNEIEIIAKYPIKNINDTAIHFVKIEDDTVRTPYKFNMQIDSLFFRKIDLSFEKEESESYNVLIPAGAITDIYGNINDTLNFKFNVRSLDHYGTLKLNLKNIKQNSIIQLLDDKEKIIIKELTIKSDTLLYFKNLDPKKYIVKLYYDDNHNKKWDTGDYEDLKQPEQVFYFPQEVIIKSNFDYDYEWDLYPVPIETSDSLPKINIIDDY